MYVCLCVCVCVCVTDECGGLDITSDRQGPSVHGLNGNRYSTTSVDHSQPPESELHLS